MKYLITLLLLSSLPLIGFAQDLPTLNFELDSSCGSESEPSPTIRIILSHAHDEEVGAELTLEPGSAQYGDDYDVPVLFTVNFPPGDTLAEIPNFIILEDDEVEEPESFQFIIVDTFNALLGLEQVHTFTIMDFNPFDDFTYACTESDIELDAGPGYLEYDWDTGDDEQILNDANSGNYTVQVQHDNGCIVSDATQLIAGTLDLNNLSNDSVYCPGDDIAVSSVPDFDGLQHLPVHFFGDGLLAYWPLNNIHGDLSGNGTNLPFAPFTSVHDRFYEDNQARVFATVDNHIEVETEAIDLAGTNSLSISFWIKPDLESVSTSQMSSIIQYREDANTPDQQYGVGIQNGQIRFFAHNSSFPDAEEDVEELEIIAKEWQNITITYDGWGIRYYIDGEPKHFESGTEFFQANANKLYLSMPVENSGDFYPYFGVLDDMAIWNRALEATEVERLYHNPEIQYVWSTGETFPTLNVPGSGTYTSVLTIGDTELCTESIEIANGLISDCFGPAPEPEDAPGNFQLQEIFIDKGTETHHLQQRLRVFPNPVQSGKDLFVFIDSALSYECYNIAGTIYPLTYSQTGNGLKISTESLLPGVYFIRIRSKNGVEVQRFVVI